MVKHNVEAKQAAEETVNRTMIFHSLHPKSNPNRASYVIPGRPGNFVIFLSLFVGGVAPATLTVDAALVDPKEDNKTAKAEAAAVKAAERAVKAQQRIQAAADKARDKQEKADAALAKARAAVEAAGKTHEQATA